MVSTVCVLLSFLNGLSVPSGPQVGDKLGDCKIQSVLGNQAGKVVQLEKEIKNDPTLVVFFHKLTRPGLSMIRPVDEFAAKHEKLKSHMVFLSDDKEETEKFLKRAEGSLNLKMPVGICLDGKNGPETYGLNDQVSVTILVAKEGKVVANFALVDPNSTDSPKVIEAVAKMLGVPNPEKNK